MVTKSEIREEKNYYPFGLTHAGYNTIINGRKHNYGFGGKEEINDLGLGQLDFGARMYNPEIGRWGVVDALADEPEQIFRSPYQYAWNNPIYYNDPDGNCPKCREFINNAAKGINRLVSMYKDGARRQAASSSSTSSGPTKNITGNYFGDAAVKLLGGETLRSAINGDKKAQFRVISGALVSMAPGGRGLGDDIVKNTSKSVSKINSSGIKQVKAHLSKMDADAANDVMVGRLEKIASGDLEATDIDVNFYTHEITESNLMKEGMSYEEAHQATLKAQGIEYKRGFEQELYTPEALEAGEAAYKKEVDGY